MNGPASGPSPFTTSIATARRDLARRARDPWSLVSWLAIPLFIGIMMTLLTGGDSGPKPKAKLLVVDLDQSFVSNTLLGALGQDRMGEMLTAETVELADGRERIAAGEASGLLVIPEGFGRAVLYEEPVELELVTNPAQRILPKILIELGELLGEAGFYAHRLFGDELRLVREMIDSDAAQEEETGEEENGQENEGPLSLLAEAQTADLAVSVRRKITVLGDALDPMALELVTVKEEPSETEEEEAERPSFALLLLPGLMLMAMVFTADGLAADLWTEQEQGTLERIRSSAHGFEGLLPGKSLASAAVFLVIGLAISLPGFAYHGLAWGRLPLTLLWLMLAGLIFYFLFVLVQTMVADRRAGTIATQLLIFPLLMAGGSFFPLEALPSGIARIGALTPNGWMGEGLKAHFLALPGEHPLLGASLGLALGVTLALALLGRWRLQHFGKAG